MKKMALMSILAVLVILSTSAHASANLILNGSFEQNTAGVVSYLGTFNAGDNYLTNWTIESGDIDLIATTWWVDADGEYSLDMNGNNPGRISQTFNTVEGTTYQVSFAMAGNFGGTGDSRSMNVGISENNFETFTYYRGDGPLRPTNVSDYVTQTWLFTAEADQTTLFFQSLTPYSSGPILDNVSVSATPIPGAVWLLGSGLIGLVGIRRKFNS